MCGVSTSETVRLVLRIASLMSCNMRTPHSGRKLLRVYWKWVRKLAISYLEMDTIPHDSPYVTTYL